jgi:hypothetical protein
VRGEKLFVTFFFYIYSKAYKITHSHIITIDLHSADMSEHSIEGHDVVFIVVVIPAGRERVVVVVVVFVGEHRLLASDRHHKVVLINIVTVVAVVRAISHHDVVRNVRRLIAKVERREVRRQRAIEFSQEGLGRDSHVLISINPSFSAWHDIYDHG